MFEASNFIQVPAEEELDVSAIFGGGNTATVEDLFSSPAPSVVQPVPAPQITPVPQPASSKVPQITAPMEMEEVPNPILAAMDAQQNKSLFDKAPVFAYGGVTEDIEDGAMTFEMLRIEKAETFPELSEGKKVSWTMEYGKITKTIPKPIESTIISMKESIEASKEFLDMLKKAKDKNPSCLVKPKVTAQSKGLPDYKGIFLSQADAQASNKKICIFPAQDGRVYELRKTELGDFVAPKSNIIEFGKATAGLTPALPPIPMDILWTVIGFFRSLMDDHEYEALAHIYWDRENLEYVVHIPKQTVTKNTIHAYLDVDCLAEDRYLHYADIHSHNSMAARFSAQDDADEKATRLYFVVGRLDKFFPDITARISVGGVYQEINPGQVLEVPSCSFPSFWREQLDCQQPHCQWDDLFYKEAHS